MDAKPLDEQKRAPIRHDYAVAELRRIFELPLTRLLGLAQNVHAAHWPDDEVQLCTLLSIKTGACPEDCAYCPQSAHYDTPVEREVLAVIKHYGSYRKIEEGWKAYALNNFRIPR